MVDSERIRWYLGVRGYSKYLTKRRFTVKLKERLATSWRKFFMSVFGDPEAEERHRNRIRWDQLQVKPKKTIVPETEE